MKLYRVAYYYESRTSAGYGFFTNQKDAQRAVKDYLGAHGETDRDVEAEIEQIEVELSKNGVLDLLRSYATHAENG